MRIQSRGRKVRPGGKIRSSNVAPLALKIILRNVIKRARDQKTDKDWTNEKQNTTPLCF